MNYIIKKGIDSVERFTNNLIDKLKKHEIPITLLSVTEKITEYKNGTTVSQKEKDLKALPGESVTFYVVDIHEAYTTPKKGITKVRKRFGYKRIEDYNNDYSIFLFL